MNYENLLIEAEKAGAIVKEVELRTSDGFCKGNKIAINKKLKTAAERACILSEELGHFKKTIGDITDQSKLSNRKQELIARRWGHSRLVGMLDLIKAYDHGCMNRYEIAEYLNVTESFLEEALEYYRQKYGMYYSIDKYIIYFEPSLGIVKMF